MSFVSSYRAKDLCRYCNSHTISKVEVVVVAKDVSVFYCGISLSVYAFLIVTKRL